MVYYNYYGITDKPKVNINSRTKSDTYCLNGSVEEVKVEEFNIYARWTQ